MMNSKVNKVAQEADTPIHVETSDKPKWGAKYAFLCYLTVAVGVLIVAASTGLLLHFSGFNLAEPPYPISLVSIPVNEISILLMTLAFIKRSGANIGQMGFRRISAAAVLKMIILGAALLLLTATVGATQNAILGHDPAEQIFAKFVVPRTQIQLVFLVVFAMVLVGPIEELFARAYIQKGLENHFGRVKGLLLASLLFGMLHALNVVRAIIPTFVAGLFLGYIWQKTGRNTTSVAVLHGAYDSIALTLAFLFGA
jgi:membrane protease YdiL (CAAX protease family)